MGSSVALQQQAVLWQTTISKQYGEYSEDVSGSARSGCGSRHIPNHTHVTILLPGR